MNRVFVFLSLCIFFISCSEVNKTTVQVKEIPPPQISDPFNGNPIDTSLYADINGYRIFVSCMKCLRRLRPEYDLAMKNLREKYGERPLTVEEAQDYKPDFSEKFGNTSGKPMPIHTPYLPKSDLDFPATPVFENAKPNSEVTFTLEGINNTGKTINFTTAKSTCGCSDVEIVTKTVEAGGKITLNFVFRTKGVEGEFTKSIYLFSKENRVPYKVIYRGSVLKE